MDGWIKLHRQIQNSTLWTSEPFSRGQAWVDLLLLANHKDSFFYKRGNKVAVSRGQLGVSVRGLSDRWRWSRGKVIRFLDDLKEEQQIEPQKSNVTTLITICNYDTYQSIEPQTVPRTSHEQATDEPIQECKEEKSNSDFEKFWISYHKISGKTKTDKSSAEKHWKKLSVAEQKKAQDNIQAYADSQPEIKYRKKARTYLADKNFNDEFPESTAKVNGNRVTINPPMVY